MRLTSAGQGQGHGDLLPLRAALAEEAGRVVGAQHGIVLSLEDGGRIAVDHRGRRFVIAEHAALVEPLALRHPLAVLDPATAQALIAVVVGGDATAGSALLMALPEDEPTHLLILSHPERDAFDGEAISVAGAIGAAGATALTRRLDAREDERLAARNGALTRAAKTLHESLDLPTVLSRICAEATRILDADYTAVYRYVGGKLQLEAVYGLPPELIGFKLDEGQGLAGKVSASGRSMLTNEYPRVSGLPTDGPFSRVRSCVAAPMRWGGELRGVITVGYMRVLPVTDEHLGLLETFGELATVACTNATAHAGLALAARTDGLTGCLNHAALQESLRCEIERAERSVTPALSLVMVDLDDFKSVNELHGHLVGDEVLRRAGHALRQAIRPYDIAARYGGDEFALIAVESGEAEAEEIASRAIERITTAIGDLCEGNAGRATAGVAEWSAGVSATELIARADRALLFGKHENGRGRTIAFSDLPDWFRPGRFTRRGREDAARGVTPASASPQLNAARAAGWPDVVAPAEQRLRDRARRLSWANGLGARLSGTEDELKILTLAASELGDTLDAVGASVVCLGRDANLEHVAGASPDQNFKLAERAIHEGRPLLFNAASGPARIAVPITRHGEPWGALHLRARNAGAYGEDELHLATTVADHAVAALSSALQIAALRRQHDGAGDDVGAPPASWTGVMAAPPAESA